MHKIAVFFAVVMGSTLAFADGELLPPDHSMCLNADNEIIGQSCEEGTRFYTAADGRCGCLSPNQFHSPDFCAVAFIYCEANAPYASLYEKVRARGGMRSVYRGCGCFTTFDGMRATSIR